MPQQQIGFYGQLRPTGVDTSEAQRLKAMAGLADSVGKVAFQVGKYKASELGTAEGQKAGTEAAATGTPIKPRDSIFPSFFDDAYNNAMKSSYIAGVENSARENLARIANESPDDLDTFNSMAGEWTKGARESVSSELIPMFDETIGKLTSSYRTQVIGKEVIKNKANADAILVNTINTAGRDALRFASMGMQEDSNDALATAFAALDARVLSGTLNEPQAQELKRTTQVAVNGEAARGGLQNIISTKGIISAVDFIQKIDETPMGEFSTDEQRKLVDTLRSDLSQHINLKNIEEKQADDSRKAKQDATANSLFVSILNGTADQADITMALIQNALDFSKGNTLTTLLNNRGRGTDDYQLIRDINESIRSDPEMAIRMIERNAGSALTESTATSLFTSALNARNAESPLKSNKTNRFRSYLQESVKVVGPMGAVDFDSQKRLAKLEVVFDERVLNGEDPAVVANDLVDVNDFLQVGTLLYGDTDDLKGAQEELDAALTQKEITPATYNLEYEKIQTIKRGLQLGKRFEQDIQKALKESN